MTETSRRFLITTSIYTNLTISSINVRLDFAQLSTFSSVTEDKVKVEIERRGGKKTHPPFSRVVVESFETSFRGNFISLVH